MEILILLIIISIVSKLFDGGNNKQEKEKQNQRPTRRPPNTSTPRAPQRPRPTPTPSGGRTQNRQPAQSTIDSISVEEQQKKQMERLAGQMKTQVDQSFQNITKQEVKEDSKEIKLDTLKKENISQKQTDFRKRMKKNLNRDGLVNSVIMAEVLGSPKARKPYRSVVADRKR